MYKLTEPTELEKAGRSLASFFAKRVDDLEKNHAFHKAMSGHHAAAAESHTNQATASKAVHDSLGDDHEMKAHLGKVHGHHTAMAVHHTAMSQSHASHAETMKAELAAMKALSAEWGGTAKAAGAAVGTEAHAAAASEPGTGVAAMITETTTLLTKKALESLDNDPVVQEKIREMVLKGVSAALGDKIVPDNVHGVISVWPAATIVPRAGAPTSPQKPNVPLEFEHLVKVEDE